MRCDQCKHYSAKLIVGDDEVGGMGKCFKLAESLLMLNGSYAVVNDEFFCANFENEEKSPD